MAEIRFVRKPNTKHKFYIWRNCRSGQSEWGTAWRFWFIEGWIPQKYPIPNLKRFQYPFISSQKMIDNQHREWVATRVTEALFGEIDE